jgi:hypothetical protein
MGRFFGTAPAGIPIFFEETMEYPLNQFAPVYQQGIPQLPPSVLGYEDRMFEYVYNVPGGSLNPDQYLEDIVQLNVDADFFLDAWWFSYFGSNLGFEEQISVQLVDSFGYQLTDGAVLSAAISTAASDPTVLCPTHRFARGTEIQISLQQVVCGNTPFQLVFRGRKRFYQGGQ